MRLNDILQTASRGLRHAKLRSLLTMLGIVIGIGSVILLMSIGASAQQLILDQVQGIGSDLIFVIPGATKGSRLSSPASVQGIVIKTLTEKDVDALRREPSVEKVAAEVRGQAKMVYENNDATVTYEGTSEEFFPMRNFDVVSGRPFTNSEAASFDHVAVLGSELTKTLFGEKDPIGKTVRLSDLTFRIIGVLEEKGVGPFGIDQDNLVIIPLLVAQKQLLGIDYYNAVTIQANNTYTIAFTAEAISSAIRRSHGITNPDKDDFTVRTQEDALSILGNITSVLSLFLTSIAFISLVVGGIGIMNIMLVSVVERTREIGLRKALGATQGDILSQFLCESVMLTLVGGIAGITAGSLVTIAVYLGVTQFTTISWVLRLPLYAILLAAAVSTITGLAFGIYPAYRASKLNPTDALRYE